MRRISLLLLIAILLLSACGTQSSSTSPAPATATVQQLPDASPTPQAETQATPTFESASASAEAVTYAIVPDESQVSYTVDEVFINQNNRLNTAVGTTSKISGEILLDRANPKNSQIKPITIDISQFTSDSARRDNALRDRFLESARFPEATFTPTQIEGLPDVIEEGKDYKLTITGDLGVKEASRPVSFDTTVRLEGEQLSGQATTTLLMSDFGVGPISLGGILKTEDEVQIQFDFLARPGAAG
jgi:polyisoprenoid-binding protein YceI